MGNPMGVNKSTKIQRIKVVATDTCPACGSTAVRTGAGMRTCERICTRCACYWEWPSVNKTQVSAIASHARWKGKTGECRGNWGKQPMVKDI